VQILLTIVRDGNFAEDHERRLRNRYAVLTALSASGLVPEDSQHIQFFRLRWIDENELDEKIELNKVPKIHTACANSPETMIVPYEWFKCQRLYPPSSAMQGPDRRPKTVVVVWLPESAFSHRPLTRLAQIIDALGCRCNRSIRIDVVGPSYSDTLLAMLNEIADSNNLTAEQATRGANNATAAAQNNEQRSSNCSSVDVNSMLEGLTIFSPWSTASPVLLVKNWRDEDPNENSELRLYRAIPHAFARICTGGRKGVKFVRTIGSDDLLVQELINELYRRGVDVLPDPNGAGHDVALISEWDTFYGKAFPLIFATMMESFDHFHEGRKFNWTRYTKNLKQKIPRCDAHYFPENLHTYNYIRGVDGKLPESQAPERQSGNEKTESESRWAYAKNLELPIGKGQLDYVRRLAQDLKDEHKRGELKAIGVVGSDVYDKLILLHALREQFDDVIFFTTDLDARLMHHEQFKWTRNAIVASNFCLALDGKYHCDVYQDKQKSLPPFRDNYQTALFFACRIALGLRDLQSDMLFRQMCLDQLTEVISHPRLFEIGRGRAVDLSVNDADIHPPRPHLITDWDSFKHEWPFRTAVLLLLAIAFCTSLLVQINPLARDMLALTLPKAETRKKIWTTLKNTLNGENWRVNALKKRLKKFRRSIQKTLTKILDRETWKTKTLQRAWERLKTSDLSAIGVKVAVVALVVFVLIVNIDHYRPGGEPFSLIAGVSIWPGEALRLMAAILSVYFIAKALKILQKNSEEMDEDFELQQIETARTMTYAKWLEDKKKPENWKRRLASWWSYRRWMGIHGWPPPSEKVSPEEFWRPYLIRGACGERVWRTARMTLTYVLLAVTLVLILRRPNTPYRGDISRIVHFTLLIVSVFSMIVLISFVVDTTRLSLRLVRDLKTPATAWPDELVEYFSKEKSKEGNGQTDGGTKLPKGSTDQVGKRAIAEWLDIRFIASHTEAVGRLIYYPFIVLLVMFVARNRYFDDWNFPISLIVVFLLNSTCALYCALMLRHEAEKTRTVALDRLQKKLVEATGRGQKQRSEQLQAMIEEVRSIRQGAYSPFTENPVLHAILIPSGGMSLLTLLRFLLPS
jgi:hypothetical protein